MRRSLKMKEFSQLASVEEQESPPNINSFRISKGCVTFAAECIVLRASNAAAVPTRKPVWEKSTAGLLRRVWDKLFEELTNITLEFFQKQESTHEKMTTNSGFLCVCRWNFKDCIPYIKMTRQLLDKMYPHAELDFKLFNASEWKCTENIKSIWNKYVSLNVCVKWLSLF